MQTTARPNKLGIESVADQSSTVPFDPASSRTFECSECGQQCEWRPQYVGKVAMCQCGHVMKVPDVREPVGDQVELPIPHVPAPPRRARSLPDQGPVPEAELKDADDEAVERELAALAGYGEEDPSRPDPFRDLHAPIALIVLGLVIIAGQAAYLSRSGIPVPATLLFLLGGTLIHVIVMFLGVLVAAKVGGINFGPVGPAVLKLLAVYLAPSTIGGLVTDALGGDAAVAMIGFGVAAVLYWTLLSYLFRLDGSQTATCVAAIAVTRWVTQAVIIGIVFAGLMTLPSPSDSSDSGEIEQGSTASVEFDGDEP